MHARSRKLPVGAATSREEMTDAFPPDDGMIDDGMGSDLGQLSDTDEGAEKTEKSAANEPICLACGGDGSRYDGCDHAEVARLHEPSRAAGEIIERLRRAAAEHRAASRALRALVTSELSRDRADLTTKRPVEAPSLAAGAGAPGEVPCPRCAERASEGEIAGSAVGITAARSIRKRARATVDQQSLPFSKGPVRALGGDDAADPGERTIERLPL